MNALKLLNLWRAVWIALAILLYFPFAVVLVTNIAGNIAHPNLIWDDQHLLPQAYFAMFWFSGILLWQHFAALHGLPPAPSPVLDHNVHIQLAIAAPFHLTWFYPPVMGLLSLLYACLPLHLSFWVWRALSLLISAFFLRKAGLGWGPIWLGLLGPATIVDFVEGENGVLTGGFAAASLLMMESAPKSAGALASLLSIKPTTALAFPFILLQPRLRKPFLAALLSGLVLFVLTLPFFGIAGWRTFLFHATPGAYGLASTPLKSIFPVAGATTLYMMQSFGLSPKAAFHVQLVTALIAAIAIWRLWMTPGRPAIPRMATTLSLAALLMPYGYLHDMIGFSVGMMAMCFYTSPARRPVYVGLWLFAGHSATIAAFSGHILMPLAAL